MRLSTYGLTVRLWPKSDLWRKCVHMVAYTEPNVTVEPYVIFEPYVACCRDAVMAPLHLSLRYWDSRTPA